MYIANHYVRINGRVFVKGERIPEDLPAEKIEWLLEKGAVHEAASLPSAEAQAGTPDTVPAETAAAEEQEVKPQTAQEPAEEADEDAEAPEIDVMAGIVQGAEDEAPKKTTRTKTAAKKQTGRRKSG